MFKLTSAIVALCLLVSVAHCQTNTTEIGSFIRFINSVEGRNFTVQTTITVPELAFMGASDYTQVANGSLAVQLLEGATAVFPTPQLIQFLHSYTTVLIVNNNGTIIMVPYNETLAPSMSANFFNATNNQTLPNRDWVRLISSTFGQLVQVFPNSDTSSPIFSDVGFLSATAFVEINPATDTKFLVTLQFNTSESATVQTTYNLSSAYTIISFGTNEGLTAAIYFDRVIPVTPASNATNATHVTTGLLNATMTSGLSNATHVTTGIAATSGVHATSGLLTTTSPASTTNHGLTTSVLPTNSATITSVSYAALVAAFFGFFASFLIWDYTS